MSYYESRGNVFRQKRVTETQRVQFRRCLFLKAKPCRSGNRLPRSTLFTAGVFICEYPSHPAISIVSSVNAFLFLCCVHRFFLPLCWLCLVKRPTSFPLLDLTMDGNTLFSPIIWRIPALLFLSDSPSVLNEIQNARQIAYDVRITMIENSNRS